MTSELLLALIAIFIVAKLFGEIAERVGQPAVLGEMVGGIIVGESGLRVVDPRDPTIHFLSELGVILLLFLIGLETDVRRLASVGAAAFVVALALAPYVVRGVARLRVSKALLFTSLVIAFTLAWIADVSGSAMIIGAFAAGLVLARTERGHEITHEVSGLAVFFVPIFFVSV